MAPYVQQGDSLESFLRSFWQRQIATSEEETPDFKHPPLPLARIKKVMKSDPDVKMISADAPILFAKACEIFITEMTARAWIVAESSKRRTLSRADIARAIGKSDQFDFLIDILPREEAFAKRKGSNAGESKARARADSVNQVQPGGGGAASGDGMGEFVLDLNPSAAGLGASTSGAGATIHEELQTNAEASTEQVNHVDQEAAEASVLLHQLHSFLSGNDHDPSLGGPPM